MSEDTEKMSIKSSRSSKSHLHNAAALESTLCGPWISVADFMAVHPIIVEKFHSVEGYEHFIHSDIQQGPHILKAGTTSQRTNQLSELLLISFPPFG